jgi:hypothetical protein
MAKRKRKTDPDLSTALAEMEVKYGPQVAQVKNLVGEAVDQYKGDVQSAKETAAAARSYARQAIPGVEKIYTGATQATRDAQSDVKTAFGDLGGAADVFRAATAREQGGARSRIADAAARAKQDLVDRGTQATAGEQLAIGEARRGYGANIGKLQDQLTQLTATKQSDLVARLGQLGQDRADRDLKVRLQNLENEGDIDVQSQRDKAARERAEIAADAKDKKKTKDNRAKPAAQQKFSDEVGKAMEYAKDYPSRSEAASDLLRGAVPSGDKTKGTYDPGLPSFRQLPLSIALDMYFDKHVSRVNARRLHDLGYKVSDVMGATSFQDWLKTPAGQAWTRGKQAGRDQAAERAAERK